jgi:signal transduction histidine kinase/CheY-like chemotaxis protein
MHALVLAPRGRDASVIQGLFRESGVDSILCRDVADLAAKLNDDVAFAFATLEGLRNVDLRPLGAWIARQPKWSDMPFILATERGGSPDRNPIAAQMLEALSNISFIERPFHSTTLQSLVNATMKSRLRQIEARGLLEQLQQSADQLERRVEERTGQLQSAHSQLLAQMAERARTEEQLRHMQKIESIGELTGGVAHDFNNLLTAVLGNLELLRKRMPANPSTDRLIDGALQGAQRGAALTQRLLAFARRQALELKPIELAQLVTGMGDLLRRSIGPTVEIQFDVPSGLPAAQIDANQIELALLNLAVNARDAMPDGGRMTISLAAAESSSAHDMAAGKYLVLAVSDTGMGMDAATLERAIEPFFSTKEVGKGTGLGLSMIHGLALQLKGALRLYSEVGKGTRAELWLPMSDGAAAVPVGEVAAAPAPGKHGVTLLFVDDDFLIRMSTASLLEDLGYAVLKAASGAEALELLKAGQKIDMMITDYAMPGMTGIQLAEKARTMHPGLPILLATGYADLPARGALDLPRLSKPYRQSELAQTVGNLLG